MIYYARHENTQYSIRMGYHKVKKFSIGFEVQHNKNTVQKNNYTRGSLQLLVMPPKHQDNNSLRLF
jgi:hypothetical protein